MITEEVERMSGRALRRTFPSICTRTDRKRVYMHLAYLSSGTLAFFYFARVSVT